MAGDLTDLDAAYELPENVTDPKMRGLYEVLVHRMRNEAKHLPMNTVQMLLIERIAYNYIVLRGKEAGDAGGFANAAQQKDFNSFWLSMTAEFNRMLGKVEVPAATDRRAVFREMQQIIAQTVATVPDPKIRSELLEKMALAFENAGI